MGKHVQRFVGKRLGEFSLLGQGAQPIDLRQGRDLLQAGFIARQPGAHQASRGTDDLGARALERPRQVVPSCTLCESYPAEGPVPSSRDRLGDQHLDRGGRSKPVKIRTGAFASGVNLTLDSRPGHLAVVGDERITVGRRGTRVAHRPIDDSRCFRRSRSGLIGGSRRVPCPSAAIRAMAALVIMDFSAGFGLVSPPGEA